MGHRYVLRKQPKATGVSPLSKTIVSYRAAVHHPPTSGLLGHKVIVLQYVALIDYFVVLVLVNTFLFVCLLC